MSNMRFFYFSIILTIWRLINESSRELSETPEKNPGMWSDFNSFSSWYSRFQNPCFILYFFTVSRKKDSCLFFQFTRYLRNLLKLSKPQQLYNRAKARSKDRKLMVLFCLNTKPVRKKDYPTLSQPWSLLKLTTKGWIIFWRSSFIFHPPLFSHNSEI